MVSVCSQKVKGFIVSVRAFPEPLQREERDAELSERALPSSIRPLVRLE